MLVLTGIEKGVLVSGHTVLFSMQMHTDTQVHACYKYCSPAGIFPKKRKQIFSRITVYNVPEQHARHSVRDLSTGVLSLFLKTK